MDKTLEQVFDKYIIKFISTLFWWVLIFAWHLITIVLEYVLDYFIQLFFICGGN
jgi:hypothetical protein